MSNILATVTENKAASGLISLMERVNAGVGPLLRVLTYHRVSDPRNSGLAYPRVSVHPRIFEQHMRFLSSHYSVVAMADVLSAVRGETRLPHNAVLITFDDGYTDFAETAFPVMQRYGLPVTLFVPTNFPTGKVTFWWDQLYAAIENAAPRQTITTPLGDLPMQSAEERKAAFSQLRDYVKGSPHGQAMAFVEAFCAELNAPHLNNLVLSWDQLRELAKAGVTLGPHTRSHPMLDQISVDEACAEALGSWQDLREQIGETLPVFAYPSGGYTQAVVQALREAGFELAFTTQRGLNDLNQVDRLQIKRINIGPKTSLPLLRLQLLGWMKYFKW